MKNREELRARLASVRTAARPSVMKTRAQGRYKPFSRLDNARLPARALYRDVIDFNRVRILRFPCARAYAAHRVKYVRAFIALVFSHTHTIKRDHREILPFNFTDSGALLYGLRTSTLLVHRTRNKNKDVRESPLDDRVTSRDKFIRF